MTTNMEMYAFAKKFLGQGGTIFRKYCGLPAGAAYCNAFVTYVFQKTGNGKLFCDNKITTYCPTSIKWCQSNLAQIPIYLALPMDVIYFDWEPNGIPNHIGFVRERKSDQEVYTIEGNTSGGIVAQKTRTAKYVCGCFRPHYKPTSFSASKKLTVDGYFGYNSIAVMQRWLGVTIDAILGQGTVKALQKRLGLKQDGYFGPKTSKALQKLIGTTADGYFGPNSVRAFQTYLNNHAFTVSAPEVQIPATKESTTIDKVIAWATKIATDDTYHYVTQNTTNTKTRKCCICEGYPHGKYHGWNCIRFVGAAYYHGGGVPIKAGSHTLVTYAMANKMLKGSADNASALWKDRNGDGWSVIMNGRKAIPASMLKAGDVVICFDKTGSNAVYKHMVLYIGDGYMIDATSSHGIAKRKYSALGTKPLIAMRYTGK